MAGCKVVLDTNVLVAALRSRKGASFRLLSLLGQELYRPCVSVPLVFEYEDVLKRVAKGIPLTDEDIDDFLDYVCSVSERRPVFFLWRPVLRDPKDDFLLELAVESGSQYIVTFNVRDFEGCERFGIEVVTPRELLQRLGETT
ncbi:MAG: putative toxin-antitoxin system toxin component, PIN family [Gammaproteobacteria bacterium]|nr:putative toxin-antitoxin system toxin component, PIN family [Gammaproteobacteria bacterium]